MVKQYRHVVAFVYKFAHLSYDRGKPRGIQPTERLKNKTVLLVTHDPLEALRLGDEVQVMAGQPAQLGEPIYPPGDSPRGTMNKQILVLQGELLTRLEKAQQAMQ